MPIDFVALRRTMVDSQIRTMDVTDLNVLQAFLQVEKQQFVPKDQQPLAYLDRHIQLTQNPPARFMMPSAILAKLIQSAKIDAGETVLDIGGGLGYGAAILAQLAQSVIAIESQPDLVEKASENLVEARCDNVVSLQSDLKDGYGQAAPYDVILIEGAVEFVPEAILAQLKDNGRLICVEGYGNSGRAKLYLKEDGLVSSRILFNASLRPLVEFQRAKAFAL